MAVRGLSLAAKEYRTIAPRGKIQPRYDIAAHQQIEIGAFIVQPSDALRAVSLQFCFGGSQFSFHKITRGAQQRKKEGKIAFFGETSELRGPVEAGVDYRRRPSVL
jgi:hypothetical protein